MDVHHTHDARENGGLALTEEMVALIAHQCALHNHVLAERLEQEIVARTELESRVAATISRIESVEGRLGLLHQEMPAVSFATAPDPPGVAPLPNYPSEHMSSSLEHLKTKVDDLEHSVNSLRLNSVFGAEGDGENMRIETPPQTHRVRKKDQDQDSTLRYPAMESASQNVDSPSVLLPSSASQDRGSSPSAHPHRKNSIVFGKEAVKLSHSASDVSDEPGTGDSHNQVPIIEYNGEQASNEDGNYGSGISGDHEGEDDDDVAYIMSGAEEEVDEFYPGGDNVDPNKSMEDILLEQISERILEPDRLERIHDEITRILIQEHQRYLAQTGEIEFGNGEPPAYALGAELDRLDVLARLHCRFTQLLRGELGDIGHEEDIMAATTAVLAARKEEKEEEKEKEKEERKRGKISFDVEATSTFSPTQAQVQTQAMNADKDKMLQLQPLQIEPDRKKGGVMFTDNSPQLVHFDGMPRVAYLEREAGSSFSGGRRRRRRVKGKGKGKGKKRKQGEKRVRIGGEDEGEDEGEGEEEEDDDEVEMDQDLARRLRRQDTLAQLRQKRGVSEQEVEKEKEKEKEKVAENDFEEDEESSQEFSNSDSDSGSDADEEVPMNRALAHKLMRQDTLARLRPQKRKPSVDDEEDGEGEEHSRSEEPYSQTDESVSVSPKKKVAKHVGIMLPEGEEEEEGEGEGVGVDQSPSSRHVRIDNTPHQAFLPNANVASVTKASSFDKDKLSNDGSVVDEDEDEDDQDVPIDETLEKHLRRHDTIARAAVSKGLARLAEEADYTDSDSEEDVPYDPAFARRLLRQDTIAQLHSKRFVPQDTNEEEEEKEEDEEEDEDRLVRFEAGPGATAAATAAAAAGRTKSDLDQVDLSASLSTPSEKGEKAGEGEGEGSGRVMFAVASENDKQDSAIPVTKGKGKGECECECLSMADVSKIADEVADVLTEKLRRELKEFILEEVEKMKENIEKGEEKGESESEYITSLEHRIKQLEERMTENDKIDSDEAQDIQELTAHYDSLLSRVAVLDASTLEVRGRLSHVEDSVKEAANRIEGVGSSVETTTAGLRSSIETVMEKKDKMLVDIKALQQQQRQAKEKEKEKEGTSTSTNALSQVDGQFIERIDNVISTVTAAVLSCRSEASEAVDAAVQSQSHISKLWGKIESVSEKVGALDASSNALLSELQTLASGIGALRAWVLSEVGIIKDMVKIQAQYTEGEGEGQVGHIPIQSSPPSNSIPALSEGEGGGDVQLPSHTPISPVALLAKSVDRLRELEQAEALRAIQLREMLKSGDEKKGEKKEKEKEERKAKAMKWYRSQTPSDAIDVAISEVLIDLCTESLITNTRPLAVRRVAAGTYELEGMYIAVALVEGQPMIRRGNLGQDMQLFRSFVIGHFGA